MTRELQQLRETLDGLRAGVLKKLAGLGDADARRSTVDSGINLARDRGEPPLPNGLSD